MEVLAPRVNFNQVVRMNSYTTAARDLLSGSQAGDIIYNTDQLRFQFYNGSQWLDLIVDDDSFLNAIIFG